MSSYTEDLHTAALAYHRLPRPGKLEIKAIKPLADMNIRRDGILDIHHVKGPFSWLNPVEQAAGLCGGGTYDSSYIYRESFKNGADGYMNDFIATDQIKRTFATLFGWQAIARAT